MSLTPHENFPGEPSRESDTNSSTVDIVELPPSGDSSRTTALLQKYNAHIHRLLTHMATPYTRRVMQVVGSIAAVLFVGAILASYFLPGQPSHNEPAGWRCPSSIPPASSESLGAVQFEPVLAQTVLYMSAGGQQIDAVRARDGVVMRTYKLANANLFNMAVSNGVIYPFVQVFPPPTSYTSPTLSIYAFRASDGSILWHHPIAARSTDQLTILTSPLVDNGVVYAALFDQHIYAFRASDGRPLGQYPAPKAYASLAMVQDGILYFQDAYAIYAQNAANGRLLWRYKVNDQPASLNFVVAGGRVYITKMNSSIDVLQASNGHLIHAFTGGLLPVLQPMGSLAAVNDVLYANSGTGYIYALRVSDGAHLWCTSVNKNTATFSSMLVSGVAYVSTTDGDVYALDVSNGKPLWQFQTGISSVELPPLAGNGIVYAVSLNNTVYALRANDGSLLWSSR